MQKKLEREVFIVETLWTFVRDVTGSLIQSICSGEILEGLRQESEVISFRLQGLSVRYLESRL